MRQFNFNVLKPTKGRRSSKKIFGFDIETYNKNKNFYCASIYGDDLEKTFFYKSDIIEFFKSNVCRDSIIAATNLSFDFMGIFYKKKDILKSWMLWRGSDLILAVFYIYDGKFITKAEATILRKQKKKIRKITFIDTLNYARMSVEKIGKILKIPKLDKPDFLGKFPKTEAQKKELIIYNMRDSEISQKFIKFLYDSFHNIGATPKITIASTAMSLFKNRYLKNKYYRNQISDLLDQFNGYYGGRCEAIGRGEIKNYNYYDFNSLYPSVMLNEFPDPNTLRTSYKNTTSYIENFEGFAEVDIYCPKEFYYPLLPFRFDNKLLFPTGNFRGTYTNVELRRAMELGYTIKKVHKNIYFKNNCIPFREYVTDLYELRKEYKEEKNPIESVIKLLMNSLYGKFGQKFMDRDNWLPMPDTIEELHKYDFLERHGDFIRVKEKFTEPKCFCIPAWCSYVTAYGRIKLHEWVLRSQPIYYDTDSLITKKEYDSSTALGKLKLEYTIKKGIIVKPKFYGFIDSNNKENVRIKGMGTRMNYDDFKKFVNDPTKKYLKFMKFKESVRRGYIPNEIISMSKTMTLEDDKRIWSDKFNKNELQISTPKLADLFLLEKTQTI